jgi:hypothetical protein
MSSTATSKHPAQIGRYRITGVIGRGGMGTVYRGHDDALDRDVAVKVIHDRFGHSENVLRRFGEEAKSVARLSSPHIVHVQEFGPLAVPPFLVVGRPVTAAFCLATDLAVHAPAAGPRVAHAPQAGRPDR